MGGTRFGVYAKISALKKHLQFVHCGNFCLLTNIFVDILKPITIKTPRKADNSSGLVHLEMVYSSYFVY